jgi:hypothetical protein
MILNSTAAALRVYSALGGPVDTLRALEARLDSLIRVALPVATQRTALFRAFVRPASVAFPNYRFASMDSLVPSGAYLIRMLNAWSRGDSVVIQREFRNLRATRQWWSSFDAKIDAVMPETWLLAQAGDAQGAIDWLDPVLTSLRATSPLDLVDEIRPGTLVRAMALRADLAERVGNHSSARQWASTVVQLWSDADEFLQPTVQRMRRLTK